MKSKKQDFRTMSDKQCGCGNKIKQNVIDRKTGEKLPICFKCYRSFSKKDGMSTAHEVRRGKKKGRAKGRYSPLKG